MPTATKERPAKAPDGGSLGTVLKKVKPDIKFTVAGLAGQTGLDWFAVRDVLRENPEHFRQVSKVYWELIPEKGTS